MPVYRFPPFEFDSTSGRLQKYSLRLKLQQKPQIVLSALLEQPGKTVTRKELYQRLWPQGTFVDFDQGLSVAVKKLRDALGDSIETTNYVATVAGVGYRFIGEVEQVAEAEPEPTDEVSLTAENPAANGGAQATGVGSSVVADPRIQPPAPHGRIFRPIVTAAALIAILASLVFAFTTFIPESRRTAIRSIVLPPLDWKLLTTGDRSGSIALSPDGAKVVFGASNEKLGAMLLLRKLDTLNAEPLSGTENGAMPFWSPDGSKIGFFADEKLKVFDLAHRSVRVVCSRMESPRGGTWGEDGTILFAESTRGPIFKVSAAGGVPVPVTELEKSPYTTHRWPEFLPDGKHFLFLAASHDPASAVRPAVFLGSLEGTPPLLLVESDSNAMLVAGRLLFASGGKLLAQPFNPKTGVLGTGARILADNVEYDRSLWHAAFAASPQLLLYRERSRKPETEVISFFDASGKMVKTASRPGIFRGVSLSPDGRNVAAMCDEPESNICLIHEDGTFTRISESPINWGPVWSPNGMNLAYGTHRGPQRFGLALKDTRARKPEKILIEADSGLEVSSWAPNSKQLLVERVNAKGRFEITVFQLADHRFRPFLSSGFNVYAGKFSPDGKWVAYQSDESGHEEIYISSYPNLIQKYLVSHNGGHAPRWSPNGRELYFLDASDTIYRARITSIGQRLKVEPPEQLFRPPIVDPPYDSLSFDVNGQPPKFVAVTVASENQSGYVLATNWAH